MKDQTSTFDQALDSAIRGHRKEATEYYKSGGGRTSLGRDMDRYGFSMGEAFRLGCWNYRAKTMGLLIDGDSLVKAFKKFSQT